MLHLLLLLQLQLLLLKPHLHFMLMLHLELVLLIVLLLLHVMFLALLLGRAVLASHFLAVRVGDRAGLWPCLDVKMLLGYVLLYHLVMVLVSLLVVAVADG